MSSSCIRKITKKGRISIKNKGNRLTDESLSILSSWASLTAMGASSRFGEALAATLTGAEKAEGLVGLEGSMAGGYLQAAKLRYIAIFTRENEKREGWIKKKGRKG